MSLFAAISALVALQAPAIDPNQLEIGGKGRVRVEPGQIVNLKTGKVATVEDIVKAADRKGWVFLGENHATAPHQQLHAQIVRGLADSGRKPVIGLEMITRPKQDVLDLWTAGKLEEADFITQVDWKGQWGYDYAFYKPIFDVAKEKQLPVLGLNVPRDWVRTVGRTGFESLSLSARIQLPAKMETTFAEHRKVFEALMGGHPLTGTRGENIYAAQVLWDEGMADTAIKYRERVATDIIVVMAGSGHVMYRRGINLRVKNRKAGDGITVVMTQAKGPIEVSKGLGDFVFVSSGE